MVAVVAVVRRVAVVAVVRVVAVVVVVAVVAIVAVHSYKNVVFPAQAEYSYFSADFRLKIFLYYS